MYKFSSLYFRELYFNTNGNLPATTKYKNFNFHYGYALEGAINQVIDNINGNGGCTIVSWDKEGVIVNQLNNDKVDNQVEEGEIGSRIASIQPSNHVFQKILGMLISMCLFSIKYY